MMKIHLLKILDASLGRLATMLCPAARVKREIAQNPQRVLFIRPGGIGDAALLIPTLRTFRHHFPGCTVDILAEQRNAQVFDFCRGLENVFCYDRPGDCLKVWRNPYDSVVDTEQWYRLSAVFGRLFGGRFLIGFGTNERRRLLSYSINYDLNRYEAFSFLSLLTPWGIEPPATLDAPFLDLPGQGREEVLELLADLPAGDFIALCPGGSRPEKSWGEGNFVALAAALLQEGLRCVVLGGPAEADMASRIATAGQGISLAGRTSLFESAVALQQSRLTVANDTGLLHLATGLGRPTVGLFGPSNPLKWGPPGETCRVLSLDLACSPCSCYGVMPECPHGSRCLRELKVETVLQNVLGLCRQTRAAI